MNVIYTVAVDIEKSLCFQKCVESQRKYADRIGVDFVVRSRFHNSGNGLGNDSEKPFMIHLQAEYNRVLYLDADVFIRDDAEDIFKFYVDEPSIVMYNEVMFNGVEMDAPIEKAINKHEIEKWKKTDGHYDWLNSGVILSSYSMEDVWRLFNKDHYFKLDGYDMLNDMPTMIRNINNDNIPLAYMDERFNTMAYFKTDGDFVHFANVLDRDERIKEVL